MRRAFATVLVCIATGALAAPVDYARQWPVVLPLEPAGAYTVELTADVYATVQRDDLRDLDVLDATGRAVPADVRVDEPSASTRRAGLPWYRMPTPGTTASGDWRVIADVDADGRLRGLRSSSATDPRPATTLLLDATALRQPIQMLEVTWRPAHAFDVGYLIEGSDDFDTWYGVGRGRLVDVREAGRELKVRRLRLDTVPRRPRYLRLVPDSANALLPEIVRVEAQWASTVQRSPTWRALPAGASDGGTFEFVSHGRYPVRWVDLDTPGNDVRTWRLQSRDALDARWIERSGAWVAYRVGAGRSPPRVFDAPVRDRYWRLVAQGTGDAPRLRLGHVPERVAFIAAGRPPYVLVAGSAQRGREPRPVHAALQATSPAFASLGPGIARSGKAALAPARDWKAWGLWAVLALGVLAVVGFALRVLREPARSAD